MIDSVELITGVSILVITPALVELAKQLGLPVRLAGLAAIICAISLLLTGDIAAGTVLSHELLAHRVIAGIVYGLAAAGLYSQSRMYNGPSAMA